MALLPDAQLDMTARSLWLMTAVPDLGVALQGPPLRDP